jgi:hypothetical protein
MEKGFEPEREDALTRRRVTRCRMLTTLYLFGALGKTIRVCTVN